MATSMLPSMCTQMVHTNLCPPSMVLNESSILHFFWLLLSKTYLQKSCLRMAIFILLTRGMFIYFLHAWQFLLMKHNGNLFPFFTKHTTMHAWQVLLMNTMALIFFFLQTYTDARMAIFIFLKNHSQLVIPAYL